MAMRNIRPGWLLFKRLPLLERAKIVARTQGYAPSWFMLLEQNPPMPEPLEGEVPKPIVLEEDRVRARLLDLFPNYQSMTVRGVVGEDRWYTNPIEVMLRRYRNQIKRGASPPVAFEHVVSEHEDEIEASGIALAHQTFQAYQLGVAPPQRPVEFEKARDLQQAHYALSDQAFQRRRREITNAKRERRPIERLTTEMLASWSITQTDLLRVLADYPELECCFEPMARMTNLRNDTDRYSESTFERGQLPEFEPELDDYDLTLDDSQPSYPETSAIECVPEMQHPSETYENDFQDIMRTILMPRKKAQKTFGSHNVDAGAFGSRNKHASSSSSSSTTNNATRAV